MKSACVRLAGGMIAAALAMALLGDAALARDITDSAGRKVTIPDTVNVVFPAGNPAQVLLYVVKPEVMAGWTRRPRQQDWEFLMPQVQDLRAVGRLTAAGDTVNLEALAVARPDIILDYGTVDEGYAAFADRIQQQAGIPYVLIDGRLENAAASLRLIGEILDVADRGEALAAFAEQAFADVDAVLATVPEAQRPRVYLARGPEGLETGTRNSINTEIIERTGGINVVEAEGGGLVSASPEQIIAWAPDTVVTLDQTFAQMAATAPNWAPVPAVGKGRLLTSPDRPFGFIDTPPSLNRLIGLYWMLEQFYPEQATFDLRDKVRAFYALFYQRELTDQQLDDLLGAAAPA